MKFIVSLVMFLASLPALAASPIASLSASRTSGTAPLCVSFDATGSTDADTTNPFRDLLYRWNFGDPNAGAWVYGTNTSASKNSARGPVTAHCYETAGSYTAKLQVCDATSCVSTSQAITVTAADTTFATTATTCFYNTTVGSGCPTGATETQSSDFDAALAACIGNTKRCLFKRGDTFTASATTNTGATTVLTVGAYGSGALPIIAGTNVTRFTFNNSSAAQITIMDLDIVGNGSTDTGACASFTAQPTHVAFVRVVCRAMGKGYVVQAGSRANHFYLYETNTYNYGAGGANAFFGEAHGGGLMGNRAGLPVNQGEHVFRIQPGRKLYIAHNTIIGGNTSKGGITIRAASHTGGQVANTDTDTQYVVASDNYLDGSQTNPIGLLGASPAGDTQCNWISDIIFERNYAISGAGTSMRALGTSGVRVTIRNNVIDMTLQGANDYGNGIGVNNTQTAASMCSADPGADPTNATPNTSDIQLTNNTIVSYSTSAVSWWAVSLQASTGRTIDSVVFKNNLAYSPNRGSANNAFPGQIGTITNLTSSNNSTTSSGTNQIKLTSPQFASSTPSTPIQFRPAVASYATNGGTAVFPATVEDFFLCRDRTGAARMGALVPAARAQCAGVAGAP